LIGLSSIIFILSASSPQSLPSLANTD